MSYQVEIRSPEGYGTDGRILHVCICYKAAAIIQRWIEILWVHTRNHIEGHLRTEKVSVGKHEVNGSVVRSKSDCLGKP